MSTTTVAAPNTAPQRALISVARELTGKTLDELAASMGYTKPISVRWLSNVAAGKFALSRQQLSDLSTRVARVMAATR